MFVATMTTEHFEFMAVGESAQAAKEYLFEGFWQHVAEYGKADKRAIVKRGLNSASRFVDADLACQTAEPGPKRQEYRVKFFDGMGLEEWYGVRVVELLPGQCARDGEVL